MAVDKLGANRRARWGGAIWDKPSETRARTVERVCEALERCYGRPRFGNPTDPLDDLVYIVISNKTSPEVALRTYRRIKESFGTWEDVLAAPASDLRSILKPAGLAAVKSEQIRAALFKIEEDFGSCQLKGLDRLDEPEIHQYLVSLPGVSDKVAKCVMMYTMGANVLPVDAHVHRVARRLGWTARKRADQSHEELEALVPPEPLRRSPTRS